MRKIGLTNTLQMVVVSGGTDFATLTFVNKNKK